MHLWIDGQCLQTLSRLRGIGRYVSELVESISTNHPAVELSISFNAAMPEEALLARAVVSGFIDPKNIHVWHGAATSGEAVGGYSTERQLDELAIAHHVNCLAPDVALSCSPFEGTHDAAVPLLPGRGCRVPIASIFYDAIPHRFPERYLTDDLSRACYRRRLDAHTGFAENLCISEFSKAELADIHPGITAHTIDAGISQRFQETVKRVEGERLVDGKFILYVGGFDWRKNVDVLVDAFVDFDRALPGNSLKLVLAGDGPVEIIEELRIRWKRNRLDPDRLIALGHVPDDELVTLYKHAEVLVQPSMMEGFGLTALEAIFSGTSVVAARAGALPEVVGFDELLFDPLSPQDLVRALLHVLESPDAAYEMQEEARLRATRFTWQRSAQIAMERLTRLVDGPTVSDREALRTHILPLLREVNVDPVVAARCLALAEPITRQSRLLVDVTTTAHADHKTGIQRVVKNIAAALADRDSDVERLFVFCADSSGWFPVDGKNLKIPLGRKENAVVPGGDTLLMLDSSWGFHAVHRRDFRACRLRGGDVVFCLYDTVPLRMPAFCGVGMPEVFSAWFRTALAHSTGFVCISRAVADELYSILDAISFPRRVQIGYWHLGADFIDGNGRTIERPVPPADARPVFLMVGTLEPRKGHQIALKAFEKLWAAGVDADLVIVGKEGWQIEALARRIRGHPEHGRRLAWHSRVDDAKLAEMYERCDALIAASYGEGFGLPLVEAGHFGKPVICSDIPVFREVGVGASSATYFQVGSSASLADAIKGFLAKPRTAGKKGPDTSWPNWRESAAELQSVVLGGNWYRTYEPRERKDYAPLGDLGRVTMTEPLPAGEHAHHLALIDGPERVGGERSLRITVAVTNLSDIVWSSTGATNGALGVFLSYHVLDAQGRRVLHEGQRTAIPFVHAPGDTLYMAIAVPAKLKDSGAAFVDIELVQEGVAWLGGALRVAL